MFKQSDPIDRVVRKASEFLDLLFGIARSGRPSPAEILRIIVGVGGVRGGVYRSASSSDHVADTVQQAFALDGSLFAGFEGNNMPKDGSAWLDGGSPAERFDSHGKTALLLVETLIHALVARSRLSIAEAIDIVDIAAEAQVGISGARGNADDARPVLQYLSAMRQTLSSGDAGAEDASVDGHPSGNGKRG